MLFLACGVIVAVCLILLHLATVPPYTGAIVTRWGKPVRSFGSGLHWIWLWESIELLELIPLEERLVLFQAEFETRGEEPIDLKVTYQYLPMPENLINFRKFAPESKREGLEKLLTERLKAILTVLVRDYTDRENVLNNIKAIADNTKNVFETSKAENGELLQRHFGADLRAVMIADPELPQRIKEAAIEQEVVEKTNRTRELEMDKMRAMATSLVEAAKKNGTDLDFETALKIIQVQFGKIKEERKQWGLDANTLQFLGRTLKGVSRGGQK